MTRCAWVARSRPAKIGLRRSWRGLARPPTVAGPRERGAVAGSAKTMRTTVPEPAARRTLDSRASAAISGMPSPIPGLSDRGRRPAPSSSTMTSMASAAHDRLQCERPGRRRG